MKRVLVGGFSLVLTVGVLVTVGYSMMSRCPENKSSRLIHSTRGQSMIEQWTDAPLRASTKFQLAASPAQIFEYLSDQETLPKWMPGLESLRYDHSNAEREGEIGVGSQRVMMFGSQSEREEIVQFNEPDVVAYRILEGVPVRNHLAVIRIEADASGGSLVTWEQYFDLKRSSIYGWLMPFMVRRFVTDGQTNLFNIFGGEAITACSSRFS